METVTIKYKLLNSAKDLGQRTYSDNNYPTIPVKGSTIMIKDEFYTVDTVVYKTPSIGQTIITIFLTERGYVGNYAI